MFKRVLFVTSFMGALYGCGDHGPSFDDRDMGSGRHVSYRRVYDGTKRADSGCKHTWKTGCVAGQLVVSPRVYLAGEEFFDVETMGKSLKQIVHVEDDKGSMLDASVYDFEVEPQITNESFKRGFDAYAKGKRSQSLRVAHDGSFVLDELTPGFYEIRVQKQFTVKLKNKVQAPVKTEAQAETSADKPVAAPSQAAMAEKSFCLTVYSDKDRVEVSPDADVELSFDSFDLELATGECKDSRKGLSVVY